MDDGAAGVELYLLASHQLGVCKLSAAIASARSREHVADVFDGWQILVLGVVRVVRFLQKLVVDVDVLPTGQSEVVVIFVVHVQRPAEVLQKYSC